MGIPQQKFCCEHFFPHECGVFELISWSTVNDCAPVSDQRQKKVRTCGSGHFGARNKCQDFESSGLTGHRSIDDTTARLLVRIPISIRISRNPD